MSVGWKLYSERSVSGTTLIMAFTVGTSNMEGIGLTRFIEDSKIIVS